KPTGIHEPPPPLGTFTVLVKVVVLLPGVGSGRQLSLVTTAVLTAVAGWQMPGTCAAMVIVAVPPGASVPNVQFVVSVPVRIQMPTVWMTLLAVKPGGTISVTCALTVLDGPLLVTVSV